MISLDSNTFHSFNFLPSLLLICMIAEFNITFQATFQYCIVFQSPNVTTKDIIIAHFHRENFISKIHIYTLSALSFDWKSVPWVNRRDFWCIWFHYNTTGARNGPTNEHGVIHHHARRKLLVHVFCSVFIQQWSRKQHAIRNTLAANINCIIG